MPKAYSYRRFSSHKQASGDSLRRQKELAEKYVAENPHLNLDLDDTLTDEGVSAYRGKHREKGALSTFLGLVLTNQIEPGSYLLIENFDRLSRETPLEALALLRQLVDNDLIVVTLHDGKRYDREILTGEDAVVPLMTSVISMYRANEESRTKGRRVRSAWENKFNLIKTGTQLTKRVPFWLTEQREVIESKARIVKEIYEMYSGGIGTYNIARQLNSRKVDPPSKRAKYWATSSITKLLRSKTTLGILTTADGVEHHAYYPAIVGEELWQSCQRLKLTSRNATGRSNTAVLSGLCRCAECGGPARKTIKTGRLRKDGTRGRWETLICSRAASNAGCPYIGLSYTKVINSVLVCISQIRYTEPDNRLLSEISRLTLGIEELESEVNEAFHISLKSKTVDARTRYLELSKILTECREELGRLQLAHGAIGWNMQEKTLQDILVNRNVTNANLRRVLSVIRVDFRKREIEVETHLKQIILDELNFDPSDAL